MRGSILILFRCLTLRIVPDELKPEIRQRFFKFFDEEDYQVSYHILVARIELPWLTVCQIARAQLRTLVTIARQEYPRTW